MLHSLPSIHRPIAQAAPLTYGPIRRMVRFCHEGAMVTNMHNGQGVPLKRPCLILPTCAHVGTPSWSTVSFAGMAIGSTWHVRQSQYNCIQMSTYIFYSYDTAAATHPNQTATFASYCCMVCMTFSPDIACMYYLVLFNPERTATSPPG